MKISLAKNIIFNCLIFLSFIFLIFFRMNNAVNFNSFWGYDGGAHLDYVRVILEEGRLPKWSENYLAWHEPTFYLVYAAFASLAEQIFAVQDFLNFTVKFLQILSAGLSLLFVFVTYKLSQQFSKNKATQLAIVLATGGLSVVVESSNYITNELGAAVLILLAVYLIIFFAKKGWNFFRIFLLAIVAGLAMITKLSALILILAFALWAVYRAVYYRKGRWLLYVFVFLIVSLGIYAPWAIYKQQQIGSAFSINAYEQTFHADELQQVRAGGVDLPNDFFYNFNIRVFSNPFWVSGSNSFWTVVLADTMSDYYMIGSNVDENVFLADDQKIMTDSGQWVSRLRFSLSLLLVYLSCALALVWAVGMVALIWRFIKFNFKPTVNLFLIIFVFGCFAALAYNVWRFPFLERGTLKASFVLAVWPVVIIIGFSWLSKVLSKTKTTIIVPIIWLWFMLWVLLSVWINWV